jgi:DNA-binding response OmpR family regulator
MASILIVEDDEELQTMMQMVLKRQGYDVYASLDGVDALYQASHYKPDLIVLDLMMPWASGDAVLGFIRSTSTLKKTRVLIVSAHPDVAKLSRQLEADGYLAKPVDMHTFTNYIQEILTTTPQ